MKDINLMLDTDLVKFLKRKKLLNSKNEVLIKCKYCDTSVTVDQIQFMIPGDNNIIQVVCSNPICINEFLNVGRTKC